MKVKITETREKIVDIEAKTEDEAVTKVAVSYANGETLEGGRVIYFKIEKCEGKE